MLQNNFTHSAWFNMSLLLSGPRLARLQKTIIDIESGKVVSHRPIGCEYYNICSLLWVRLTKNNMDFQLLINGGNRRTTSYSTKYTFKAQKPASALTLKIGLLTEAHKRILSSADDHQLSLLDRGRRAINKALHQFTKPQELHHDLAMAAYILDITTGNPSNMASPIMKWPIFNS
jgi:hypothetical protein